MDVTIDLSCNSYVNDCWRRYDEYCFDTFSAGGDTYIKGWHDILINEYKATFLPDTQGSGKRVSMPKEYYTLFLLKWA
jgi:hypothetical protein